MARTFEASRVGNCARGHRPGLVERICRQITTLDSDECGEDVPEGITGGDDEALEAKLEQRRDGRALIGTVLMLVALILYGLLLAGIDAAESASKSPRETQSPSPSPQETGCYYVSESSDVALRGEM